MNVFQRLLIIAFIFITPLTNSQNNTHVSSLDQIPKAYKSKEGLAKFEEQMNGIPLPDGFGTSLPKCLPGQTIVDLVIPGKDASLAKLIGIKRWPYRSNSYIAIVCYDVSEGKEVYLGMLEYQKKDTTLKLVATYGKPLDITTNWTNTNLDGPMDEGEGLLPHEYKRFDFAPFKLNEKETAFGIRVGWSEGYAGGGADFFGLMLFVVKGSRILNILSEPVYFSKNIAGEWHEDGTRDHDFSEGENIVIMLPHKTNGYNDLQIKEKNGKWKQVFIWHSEDQYYRPLNSVK